MRLTEHASQGHPSQVVTTSVARFESARRLARGYERYSPKENMVGAEMGSETTAYTVLYVRSRAKAANSPRRSADREGVDHRFCCRAGSFFHVNQAAHDLDC
jgi:hypothetical protein